MFIADKILLSHEPVYGLPWRLNIHGHEHNNVEACIRMWNLSNVLSVKKVFESAICEEAYIKEYDDCLKHY